MVKRLQESQAWVTRRAGVRNRAQCDAARRFCTSRGPWGCAGRGDFVWWKPPRQRQAAGVTPKPAMRRGCVKGSRGRWRDRGWAPGILGDGIRHLCAAAGPPRAFVLSLSWEAQTQGGAVHRPTVSSSVQLCAGVAADVGWEDLEHSEKGTEVLRGLRSLEGAGGWGFITVAKAATAMGGLRWGVGAF